jgi:hypothetical protein
MNSKNLTLFILATLILTTLVSATVQETNYIYDGLIKSDGSVTQGTKAVNGVSVQVFTCFNSDCSNAGPLSGWHESKNTGSSNSITINYPTTLQTDYGYLTYYSKEGYDPYGCRSNWSGEGNAGIYKNYLRRVESGSAQINYLGSDEDVEVGKKMKIETEILSPMVFTKDWFVSGELEYYYREKVELNLKITNSNGVEISSQTKTVYVGWSSEGNYDFEWTPLQEGTYKVELTTKIIDNKFKSSEIKTKAYYLTVVPEDNIKPVITIISPIEGKNYTGSKVKLKIETNEVAKSLTRKSGAWYFLDSASTAVYMTDIYHGLKFEDEIELEDGEHTIKFRATDLHGNIADATRVTFTINTNSDDDDDDDHERKEKDNKNVRIIESYDLEEQEYFNQFTAPEIITLSEKSETTNESFTFSWLTALSVILALLVIILIILILARIRS